jgi:hypothetical protein
MACDEKRFFKKRFEKSIPKASTGEQHYEQHINASRKKSRSTRSECRQRDALVKSILKTATLITVQDKPGREYTTKITEKSTAIGLLFPLHHPNLPLSPPSA